MNLSKTLLTTALFTAPFALIGCGGSSGGSDHNDLGQPYQFGGGCTERSSTTWLRRHRL